MDNPVNIFLSYARKDEKLATQLRYYLQPLEMQGLAAVWCDNEVIPGTNWADEVKKYLDAARIVLLLVSPAYFTSNSLSNQEIERFIAEKEATRDAQVIPILLKPVSLKGTPLETLKPLPKEGVAVIQWKNRDMAFLEITKNIRDIVNDLKEHNPLSAEKVQVSYQQKLWEQDLPPSNPHANKFAELNDELQSINKYLRSCENRLHVTDDPDQKSYMQHSIQSLLSKTDKLVRSYNDLRRDLKLPPLSDEAERELRNAL